jgi:hypothetical protein
MGMRGNFAPGRMGRIRRHLQLFETVLWSARLITPAQYTSGCENFDYIDAIFHLRADRLPHLFRTVGDLKVTLFRKHHDPRLRRVIIEIAVSASDRNARSGSYNTRTRNEACVDAIAQINGKKRERANISHCGKSGLERFLAVHHPCAATAGTAW